MARLKAALDADVSSPAMYDLGQQMNDMVFSFGEIGFQEVETQRYLGKLLRDNGFSVEDGVAGIPTAWVAKWGSGAPVIAFGSDIDGIPQGNQKPGVAYHDPMVDGAPGHGEGHNSGTPLNIVAALAVKRIMEREKLPGTLMIWPGVAEELLGTKAYYVRAGVFKDVDVVLYNHVGANLGTGWGDGGGSGLVSVEYTFEGETAHSAGAPWRGRSALDAVELMNVGWNYRREHLRLAQRTHYVITNGGDQPNVVPRNASVWYYFRETDYESIKNMWDIGDKMADGAALMTNTKWTSRVLGTAWPRHTNRAVAEAMHANIEHVGLPAWSDADIALAKATQRVMKVPEIGLASGPIGSLRGREVIPDSEKFGGPSDDVGDITWSVPTVVARLSGELPGRPWAQLGQRHPDGDADRPQGRQRRRARAGADRARSRPAAGAGAGGTGLFPERAAQAAEVHAVHPAHRPAGHLDEQDDDGSLSSRDAEVLLRLDEVQDLHGSDGRPVRHQVPDDQGRRHAVGGPTWTT